MNGLNLKLIMEMVDRVTAPVKQVKAGIQGMTTVTSSAAAQLDRFSYRTSRITKVISRYWAGVAESVDKVGKKMAEVGGFLTSRLTLPIVGVGALSIRSAGQVEQLVMQMEHLAGGADQARAYVKSLNGYIEKFGTEDLSNAVQLLETAGYNAGEINSRLAFLGNVAAGSRNELAALTDQYIEMRKAGKVSDGDLNTMMKARIPIVAQLEKQLGKSEKQIWNMAAEGKLTFEQYRKAMIGLTEEGGRFYQAMDSQGKSIFGVFREMGNALRISLSDLGFDLWEDLGIADKIKAITNAVRGLIEGFLGLPKWLKSTITWFVLIMAAIGPVVLIVGQLTIGVAGMLFAFSKLPLVWGGVVMLASTLFKGFNLLMGGIGAVVKILPALATAFRAVAVAMTANPIGLVIAGIAALGVAAYMLIKHWDKVSAFFGKLWGGIKAIFKESIDTVLEYIAPLLNAVDRVIGGVARLGKTVGRNVSGAWQHLTGTDNASTPAASVALPVVPVVGASPRNSTKVDAGGTIRIKIDQDNRARVVESRSNDRRMNYQADTGQLMGGF